MGEILKDLSKDKKKNLKDLPDGKRKYLTPVSDKDKDIIKGDKSESGSNSYAKNVQASVKSLKTFKEISKRYKAAKDEASASTRESGRD